MLVSSLYKIAWQSPRFWEKENHIYGGISFLKNMVDLVWYPVGGRRAPSCRLTTPSNAYARK